MTRVVYPSTQDVEDELRRLAPARWATTTSGRKGDMVWWVMSLIRRGWRLPQAAARVVNTTEQATRRRSHDTGCE